jgi:arachidonate 15-lipoxygenase
MASKADIDEIRRLVTGLRLFAGKILKRSQGESHFGLIGGNLSALDHPENIPDAVAKELLATLKGWENKILQLADKQNSVIEETAEKLVKDVVRLPSDLLHFFHPTRFADRAARVAAAENVYKFDTNWNPLSPVTLTPPIPGVPMFAYKLRDFPIAERFSPRYDLLNLAAEAKAAGDAITARLEHLTLRGASELPKLDTFAELFNILPLPEVGQKDGDLYFTRDDVFAEQRLSGPHPVAIRRPAADSRALPPPDVFLAVTGQALPDALGSGRVFVVDYIDVLPFTPPVVGQQKFGGPAAASFWWDAAQRKLMPVSITIVVANGTVLYTPHSQAQDWQRAKIFFQVADANVHEMFSHLARAHLVMEPFALATKRQFDPKHPLRQLLDHHFRFMLAKNQAALEQLIDPGGPVDQIFIGPLQATLAIALNGYHSWTLAGANPETDFKARGFDPFNDALPHYPYRDDGLLIWRAIQQMVNDYVNVEYPNDAAVAADADIQGWRADLVGPLSRTDVPAITDKATLKEVVSTLIYTCSAYHSAVNYPQWTHFAYAPNAPLAAWAPWPVNDVAPSLTAVLPRLSPALMQMMLFQAIASFHIDQLGDYATDLPDPRYRRVIDDFTTALGKIHDDIEKRNAHRFWPYWHLSPAKVLNSISI